MTRSLLLLLLLETTKTLEVSTPPLPRNYQIAGCLASSSSSSSSPSSSPETTKTTKKIKVTEATETTDTTKTTELDQNSDFGIVHGRTLRQLSRMRTSAAFAHTSAAFTGASSSLKQPKRWMSHSHLLLLETTNTLEDSTPLFSSKQRKQRKRPKCRVLRRSQVHTLAVFAFMDVWHSRAC